MLSILMCVKLYQCSAVYLSESVQLIELHVFSNWGFKLYNVVTSCPVQPAVLTQSPVTSMAILGPFRQCLDNAFRLRPNPLSSLHSTDSTHSRLNHVHRAFCVSSTCCSVSARWFFHRWNKNNRMHWILLPILSVRYRIHAVHPRRPLQTDPQHRMQVQRT
jgi:hypothetical protein